MYIIGIAGNGYGAGKTTLANHLAKEINKNYPNLGKARVFSFAKPLKDCCSSLLEKRTGVPASQLEKEKPVMDGADYTYRDVLVPVGQALRSIESDFWIMCAAQEIKRAKENDSDLSFAIFDDMRFPNERDYINTLKTDDDEGITVYLTDENQVYDPPALQSTINKIIENKAISTEAKSEKIVELIGGAEKRKLELQNNAAEGLISPDSCMIQLTRPRDSQSKIDSLFNARQIIAELLDHIRYKEELLEEYLPHEHERDR